MHLLKICFILGGDNIMRHMQEEEFDKLNFSGLDKNNAIKKCKHSVVKLYYLGTHTDYGCEKCGFKSLLIEDFEIKKLLNDNY